MNHRYWFREKTVSSTGTTVQGKVGKGRQFNGGSDYVSVPDSSSLDLTTGATVEAWVKINGVAGSAYSIISKHNSASTMSGYTLFRNSDNKYYFQGGNGTTWPSLNNVYQ